MNYSVYRMEKEPSVKPCPFSGMKCPCGCGQKYGGVCLRPIPCICCINGVKLNKSYEEIIKDKTEKELNQ